MMNKQVTCIMLTIPGRESFALRAIESFRRQLSDKAQLLIFNQGETQLTNGERYITEVFAPMYSTIGAARNAAREYVNTPYTMWWDDDDWHGAGRVHLQLEQLRLSGRPNTLANMILADTETLDALAIHSDVGYCGLVIYPSNITIKYPAKNLHEDWEFYQELKKLTEVDLIDNQPETYYRWYHGSNISSREHVYNVAGRNKRPLTMRETWYSNSIQTYYKLNSCKEYKSIEDVDRLINGLPFMTLQRAKLIKELAETYKCEYALEIGTKKGAGSAYLSKIFERVDTLDLSDRFTPNIWDLKHYMQLHNVRVLFRGAASTCLPQENYDFIYIDGGHGKQVVRHDLEAAIRYASPFHNLVIVMDDLNHTTYFGIREVFEDFKVEGNYKECYEQDGAGIIVI